MVLQHTHVGTSVGMTGLDATAVHISLMAMLVFGAAVLAIFGSFAVLVVVPLAAVVVRKVHGKRSQPSVAPVASEGPVPPRSAAPRHATFLRNT